MPVNGTQKFYLLNLVMASQKAALPFPPAEKIALYEKLLATIPGIERKGATMPYTSLNGNMFSFID